MPNSNSSRPFGILASIFLPIAFCAFWIGIRFLESAVWEQWLMTRRDHLPMVWVSVEIVLSLLGAFLITLYLTQSSSAIMKGLAIACVLTPYVMIVYYYIRLRY